MTSDDEGVTCVRDALADEPSAPAFVAAFSVLADDTRLRVIAVLYEHGCIGPDGPTLSFSELRRSVNVRDTGRFNYHLRRLRESFVDRTDDGYVLTAAGETIGAIVSDGELSS